MPADMTRGSTARTTAFKELTNVTVSIGDQLHSIVPYLLPIGTICNAAKLTMMECGDPPNLHPRTRLKYHAEIDIDHHLGGIGVRTARCSETQIISAVKQVEIGISIRRSRASAVSVRTRSIVGAENTTG